MKYGLEKEYFVTNLEGDLIIVPDSLPYDDCGLLAEARGDVFNNITDAVFSLKAAEHKLTKQAVKARVLLREESVNKVSRDLRIEASRTFQKGLTNYQNLYGYTKHRNLMSEITAGIHVSFTSPCPIYHDGEVIQHVNEMWDWVQMFRKLDEAFKDEIKNSKRRPGFYEIKYDGRIEYRSLPNTVDLFKIIEVIENA